MVPRTEPTEQEARELICEIGRHLWTRQLVAANDGNVSVRVGERVICSPTGVSKGFMRPDQLAVIGLDGTVQDPATPLASSEIKMHLRVYELDETVGAVVHAHPLYATMWAILEKSLNAKMLPETIVTMPEIPLAPYATPSTVEVADSISPYVTTHKACLLAHHGALTWGSDLMSAYLAMERLEYTAQIAWNLRQESEDIELPDHEVRHIQELFGVRP